MNRKEKKRKEKKCPEKKRHACPSRVEYRYPSCPVSPVPSNQRKKERKKERKKNALEPGDIQGKSKAEKDKMKQSKKSHEAKRNMLPCLRMETNGYHHGDQKVQNKTPALEQ
jgi:hypothetical protein